LWSLGNELDHPDLGRREALPSATRALALSARATDPGDCLIERELGTGRKRGLEGHVAESCTEILLELGESGLVRSPPLEPEVGSRSMCRSR
jgi:hypothetical protein